MFSAFLIITGVAIEALGLLMYFKPEVYHDFKTGTKERLPSHKNAQLKRLSSKDEDLIKSNGMVTMGVGLIFIVLWIFL